MSNFSEYLNNENLLIVDALNLGFRWKHERFKVPVPMEAKLIEAINTGEMDEDQVRIMVKDYFREEGAYFGQDYADTLESLAASYKAKKIIVAADSGKSTFRRGIYPAYKANREEKAAAQSVVQDAAFSSFFTLLTEALENEVAEVATVLRFPGVEADDIAAFICNDTDAKEHYEHIWLVTSDSDWDLNLCEKVSRFNWMTAKTWKNITKTGPRPRDITIENWHEHYLYPPEQHLFAKCLEGDSGDNVPGVAGIGPVRAKGLMDKYGTLDQLIAALPIKGTAQYIKNLNEFKDNFNTSLKLMDLVTYAKEAVGEHADSIKKEIYV